MWEECLNLQSPPWYPERAGLWPLESTSCSLLVAVFPRQRFGSAGPGKQQELQGDTRDEHRMG